VPVMTVLGPVDTAGLSHVQLHEHLLCDLRGYLPPGGHTKPIEPASYFEARVDRDNAADMVLDDRDVAVSALQDYFRAGGGTLVDATPLGLGRDPGGLYAIATQSPVHVVMGSGYYVQAFHPPEVALAGETELADEIVHDLTVGVGPQGIKAGIIGEIGMSWPPHPDEVKVLRAAARAQAETGAALLIHPGRARHAPLSHLREVEKAGGDIERTVMSHIDRTLFDLDDMLELAASGCVLEFDLFGTESSYYPPNPDVDLPNDGGRVRYIRELADAGYGDRVVIAEDICRKTQLKPYGGEGYDHILRRVVPLMSRRGLSNTQIDQITRRTPAGLLERPAC
jgi:phosphotriesterase-related protein